MSPKWNPQHQMFRIFRLRSPASRDTHTRTHTHTHTHTHTDRQTDRQRETMCVCVCPVGTSSISLKLRAPPPPTYTHKQKHYLSEETKTRKPVKGFHDGLEHNVGNRNWILVVSAQKQELHGMPAVGEVEFALC